MRGRLPPLREVLAFAIFMFVLTRSGFGQDCFITTVVRVLDKNSQAVLKVTAEQLRAEIDGSLSNIVSLSPGRKPGVILLFDDSHSMKDTWNQSIGAARQLAERAGDNVRLIVFRETIEAYARGATDSDKLLDQLASRTPGRGGTALYDTLIEIGNRLTTRDVAIVVISDGEDNASRHSSDGTVSLFLHSSWPAVFALILDYDHQQPRPGYFKKIPAATGGLLLAPSPSKIPAAMDELAATVFAPFVLTLRSPNPITKAAKLKLEFIGPDGKARHDMHILHAAEIAGCDAASGAPAPQE